jgi:ribonuclease HI
MTTSINQPQVTIYTDGACSGNPGPGGWGAILIFEDSRQEISGGMAGTTNNRMELTAVLEALKVLDTSCSINLYTDSKYIHDALVKGWLRRWRANGWKTASKTSVKNRDLWEALIPLLQRHDFSIHWVQGHSGNIENERCDTLAKKAAQSPGLPVDPGS